MGTGMFTGGTIWILTHGHMRKEHPLPWRRDFHVLGKAEGKHMGFEAKFFVDRRGKKG